MRIMVVCIGNICRSPIAEGQLRHKAKLNGLDWVIDSAATEGYHIGEHPHLFSQLICMEHGIDISECRSQLFTTDDFNKYDKIYAMAKDVFADIKAIAGKDNKASLKKVDYFLNELYPACNGSVPDPWFGPEEGYKEVYDLIDKVTDSIIKKYKT